MFGYLWTEWWSSPLWFKFTVGWPLPMLATMCIGFYRTGARAVSGLIAGVALLLMGVVWLVVRPIVRDGYHAEMARTHGMTVIAHVLKAEDTGNRFNENPVVRLTLRVEPPGAPAFDAVVDKVVSPISVGAVQPGSALTVSYLPAHPDWIDIR